MNHAPPMWTSNLSNFDDYQIFRRALAGEVERRARVEARLVPADDKPTLLRAYCVVCERPSDMVIDLQYAFDTPSGGKVPNWRERVQCVRCGLNNRMRGAIATLGDVAQVPKTASIYVTEQVTPLYQALSRLYRDSVGSEYLSDGTEPGRSNSAGVRFEDATRLTFPDAAFDCIVSLDVLEHIPDYRRALREFARCLKPGGTLVLSVPFELHRPETLIRAALLPSNEIEHYVEPEYHGDPLNGAGILSFATFGWSLLDDLRDSGFETSFLRFYWSAEQGYLGELQFIIVATR